MKFLTKVMLFMLFLGLHQQLVAQVKSTEKKSILVEVKKKAIKTYEQKN